MLPGWPFQIGVPRMNAQFYAAPSHIDTHGMPKHPDDLEHHQCLTMPSMTTWTVHTGQKSASIAVGGRFRMNSVGMIRQLGIPGQGIVFLPERVLADDLGAGRLQRVLPHWQGASQPIHAVTETKLVPAKTQRFIEFLKDLLRGV